MIKAKTFVFFIFAGLLIMYPTLITAQEVIDGIAATVDDRIILLSEVESQLQLLAMNSKIDLSDQVYADSLKKAILKQMIEDKLILIEAEKDTTIKITNNDVEDALNSHIDQIKGQFPSEEMFLKQLTAEGLTLKELRSRYRDEVKNQLYKERFLNKRLADVTISSGEVREFYKAYADSLPKRPAGVHLAHILIAITVSPATKDSLMSYAGLILQKARSGEDFGLLAKNYSDDGTASNDGDLGWFGRGDMVPEFEEAAFALEPGEISDIIETQFGFHIVKVTDKKEGKVKASHILFKFEPTEDDIQSKKAFADSLYQLLQQGSSFEDLAAKYSDDANSADKGGDLDWYAADQLSTEFVDAVAELQPNEFSQPVRGQFGFHILKVLDKKGARPLDFKEDYGDIEAIAKRQKAQKELEAWLSEIQDKYYIDIKI